MPVTNIEKPQTNRQRSIADALAGLNQIAAHSSSLIAAESGKLTVGDQICELPRYLYIGPKGGDDAIRLGLFAGIHGDEPEGTHAISRFIQMLEDDPQLARGYCLFIYPICNPTGFEDRTRHSRRGKDLNREFWRRSSEPEVRLLESELIAHAFNGIVCLHTDATSEGFYGFARGATLTKHLIEPALKAAGEFAPRNEAETIDGFPARRGVIRKGYEGMLSPPPGVRPRPFEIVLEAPGEAPTYLKEAAFVAALRSILITYREFIAYAPNL